MRSQAKNYSRAPRLKKLQGLSLLFLSLAFYIGLSLQRVSLDANDEKSITGRGAKSISDINMLLPISTCEECRKVSYQISAINGCFKWEVSHPNLIEVKPVVSESHPECSNIALVRALSTKPTKSLVWISARDQYSGQVLRCEVKLGRIQRLELQTHLRQFYLNDFEQIHIAAYDDEGNIFNGLDGFRFEWNLERGAENVKMVTWKEVSHASSDLKKEFEFSKLQSDVLFLKGIKQGTSVISAKISEPGYENLGHSSVSLIVTEPFVVIPQQTVYIAPTSRFQFSLAKVQLKNNDMSFSPIKLPSKQYEWNVDDSSRGLVGEDGVFISKDKEGFVSIHVVDTSIANNTAESSVKVVFPKILDIEICDVTQQILKDKVLVANDPRSSFQEQLNVTKWDNNWYLVQHHYYLLKVFIYDNDKHQILLSDNMLLANTIDTDHFDIISANSLKSEVIVRAKKTTARNQKIPLSFHLSEIRSQASPLKYVVDSQKIRSEKDVVISEAIKIQHPLALVLLPVLKSADESRNGEIYSLSARGGSGVYHWSIVDTSVATISGAGTLKSVDIGITTVYVRDVENQRNFDTINVEVTPISSVQWLEDHIEVKKQSEQAVLSLMALDKSGRKFSNCSSIDVAFDLKGAGIIAPLSSGRSYSDISDYVQLHKDLIDLKLRFDFNPQLNFLSELPKAKVLTPSNEELYLHNNFGICRQQSYQTQTEGLARVKALFTNQLSPGSAQQLETTFAEIAVYDDLVTKHPVYTDFFNNLQSRTQITSSQEEAGSFNRMVTPNEFILAFGSSIEWTVLGGTNFWKDIPEKYQVHIVNSLQNDSGEQDRQVLKSKILNEKTSHFDVSLVCGKPAAKFQLQKPHSFKVNMTQHNQVSRFLLRPALHQTSIVIKCEPPKQMSLHWSQQNNSLGPLQMTQLPQFRIFNQQKHHYVLASTQHYLRYLMLDEHMQAFFNHSSIQTEVTSSDDKLARTLLVEPSFEQAVQNNDYDMRKLQVFNQTGTVFVNAVAKGYFSRFFKEGAGPEVEQLNLPYEVKDQLRLEVVRNVDIQPKYKSIYLAKDNKFQFRINHGSGHFSVTINNTEAADKVYIDGERTVIIIPKKEGPIEIRVEDIEIPESAVTISELLISDVNELELDGPGTLVEQNSKMELEVTAYDTYGQPFGEEQYPFMNFNVEIEQTQQREKGLIAELDPIRKRKFTVKGYEPGNYQVSAFTYKFKPSQLKGAAQVDTVRVTSQVFKIEVFPLLEIYPKQLLLTPQMKYTVQVQGGPSKIVNSQNLQGSSIEIKLKVENEKFAVVDQYKEVTARQIGDTNLYYEIIQTKQTKGNVFKRTIVSNVTIPIRVRLPTDIDIPFNNQRTVYSGSMIKLIAILKYGEEIFTHGIAPISYAWNISNPSILQLNLPTRADGSAPVPHASSTSLVLSNRNIRDNEHDNSNAVFMSHFNSSTIYTTGAKQGEALVTVQLAIEYPELYKHDRNWFARSITVRVKEKLKVDIPEFINNPEKQTHLYLMPPNAYSKIETNRRTKLRLGYSQQSVYDYSTSSYQYKEVQTPIIQLVNEEGIRTLDKYGKVTVIIEESQAFSDQVVMLNVLIADIFTIATKDVYQTLNFPLGSRMAIPIKFQNDHGHQFANNIEGVEVGIELSHPRVLSAKLDQYNSSIEMVAEGSGECNVVVYLVKAPHIFDTFKVRVSSVVKPSSPVHVHVGGEVQFKIMDQSESGQPVKVDTIWSSSNPGVLDINQQSGFATGLKEGKADILLSNNINAASIAYVSKIAAAEVDESSMKNLVINTDEAQSDTRIRLKLFLADLDHELTPTVSFDGVSLIRQNVRLECESENSNVLATRAEVNDLEGFFCVMSFRGQQERQLPQSVMVTVWVSPAGGARVNAYREQVLKFNIKLNRKIRVETQYRRGINLNGEERTRQVRIFSNVPFKSYFENHNEQDKGYDLIKFNVNKTSEQSSEYMLTLTVPQEINNDFGSDLVLIQSETNEKVVIPVHFETKKSRSQISKVQPPRTNEYRDDYIEQPREIADGSMAKIYKERSSASQGMFQFGLITIFVFIILSFIIANFFKIDPVNFFKDLFMLRNPFRPAQQQQPARRVIPPALVRGSTLSQYPSQNPNQGYYPSQSFLQSGINTFAGNQGQASGQYGAARQAAPLYLSRVQNSAESNQKARHSIYASGNFN